MLSLLTSAVLLASAADAASWFPGWHGQAQAFVPGVGFVKGESISAYGTQVSRYLGIPYAKNPPPRFAPAEESGFLGYVDASTFGPACIQQGVLGSVVTEGESCLSLNIWTPGDVDYGSKLPVMVWIYGGNLAQGSTNQTIYNGTSFAANQNVVLVTINYRTNIFGFSMTPDLPLTERNAGFLDQRLALTWVSKHIGSFGGDASKVTVFGESAGGYSVEQLINFPPNPATFRAAILESRGFYGPTNGTSGWDAAVIALGCQGQDELACMRSKDAFEIKAKVANISFAPILDNATNAIDTSARIAAGETAKVPILIGTNSNEGTTLAQDFNVPPDVITDYEFTCITGRYSAALHNASYELWRYYYNASFPNTTPFPGAQAYHGSEIYEVFGTYPVTDATDQEIALSKYMQTAWATFAKDPSNGPASDWPAFGDQGLIQRLGHDGEDGGDVITAASLESYICPLYAGLIDYTGYKRKREAPQLS